MLARKTIRLTPLKWATLKLRPGAILRHQSRVRLTNRVQKVKEKSRQGILAAFWEFPENGGRLRRLFRTCDQFHANWQPSTRHQHNQRACFGI